MSKADKKVKAICGDPVIPKSNRKSFGRTRGTRGDGAVQHFSCSQCRAEGCTRCLRLPAESSCFCFLPWFSGTCFSSSPFFISFLFCIFLGLASRPQTPKRPWIREESNPPLARSFVVQLRGIPRRVHFCRAVLDNFTTSRDIRAFTTLATLGLQACFNAEIAHLTAD